MLQQIGVYQYTIQHAYKYYDFKTPNLGKPLFVRKALLFHIHSVGLLYIGLTTQFSTIGISRINSDFLHFRIRICNKVGTLQTKKIFINILR